MQRCRWPRPTCARATRGSGKRNRAAGLARTIQTVASYNGASGRPDDRSDRAGDRVRRPLSGNRPSYRSRGIEMSPEQ